jgi:hypothetical protein
MYGAEAFGPESSFEPTLQVSDLLPSTKDTNARIMVDARPISVLDGIGDISSAELDEITLGPQQTAAKEVLRQSHRFRVG